LWEENRNKKLQALAAKSRENENEYDGAQNEQLNLVENEVFDAVREYMDK
jgi:hypothetical protein